MEVFQNEDPTYPAASYWEINLTFFPHLFLARSGKRLKFEYLHFGDKNHTHCEPCHRLFYPQKLFGKK